jgi:nucleosome assembly protein 1-like 1
LQLVDPDEPVAEPDDAGSKSGGQKPSSEIPATESGAGDVLLEDLRKLQDQHDVLEREFNAERLALVQKYRALKAPVYEKRANVLAGSGGTSIPSFWVKAMKNHCQIREAVEAIDEPVLAYLQDITFGLADLQDESKGFSLTFKFMENPYFEQNELVKTYWMETSEEQFLGQDATLMCTEATQITWKPGMDITKKTVTRKQKNKRTKQIRKLTETVSVPSFFSFFMTHNIPTEEEMEAMTEDRVEELEVLVENDYELGCIFRDKIIPNALLWYTGEMVASDEDSDEEESDDDEIEDETDVEDEDEESRAAKKKDRKHAGEPPRCKQQ